jgi:RNA polymerase-binding transcription factor DksA
LESEKDETSLTYNLEAQGSSQLTQHPQKVELQSNKLVHDKNSSRAGALAARLRQIDEALHRIRTGRYGLCTNCGIEISSHRLDRDLATQYCTLCQTEAEIQEGRYTP